MKKILIIGHSHIYALQRARTADELFEFHSIPIKGIDILSEINTDNYTFVVFLIDGNYHNIFGLVNLPKPFDFYLPEKIDLPIKMNVPLLPLKLVSKVYKRNMNPIFNLRDRLSQLFKNVKIYEIESPPPLPETHIRKYPDPFKEKIDELGVSPAAFRYKSWRLHSEVVRENCKKLGITFIEAPKESQDTEGFLLEKYWNPDSTHANPLYGDLVLNQIRAIHSMDIK